MAKNLKSTAAPPSKPGLALDLVGLMMIAFGLSILIFRKLVGRNGFVVQFDTITAWLLGTPFVVAGLAIPLVIRYRAKRIKGSEGVRDALE